MDLICPPKLQYFDLMLDTETTSVNHLLTLLYLYSDICK